MSVFGSRKHVPMGEDHLGRSPGHPDRTNVTLPAELNHTHDRKFELDASQGKGLAREGTVHKSGKVSIHGGMSAQQRLKVMGQSDTSAVALKGFFDPTTKAPAGKVLRPVETSFGMRSRTMGDKPGGDEPGAAHKRAQANKDFIRDRHHALGRQILDEAYAVAGADHPENMRRAITAQQTLKDCK